MDSIDEHRTDLDISGRQLRAARSLLGWSVRDLVERSGVASATLYRLEREEGTSIDRTRSDVVRAFEDAGIRFFNDERGQGVALQG